MPTDQPGYRIIAQFEKGVALLLVDEYGVLVQFEDGAMAHLLPDDEILMRQKSFSVVH